MRVGIVVAEASIWKKNPPFASIDAGNANRTDKQKEVIQNGRKKLITHQMEVSIPHRTGAKVSQENHIW